MWLKKQIHFCSFGITVGHTAFTIVENHLGLDTNPNALTDLKKKATVDS